MIGLHKLEVCIILTLNMPKSGDRFSFLTLLLFSHKSLSLMRKSTGLVREVQHRVQVDLKLQITYRYKVYLVCHLPSTIPAGLGHSPSVTQ
jgi:hypothetical protein